MMPFMAKLGKHLVSWGVIGCSALVWTSCGSKEEAAKEELVEAGYEVSAEGFFRAVESGDLKALAYLKKAGFSMETRRGEGESGLHAAAGAGMKDAIRFFLDQGMPVDLADGRGRTPLMAAVLASRAEAVRYLLAQGADPQKKDAEGFKALMLAVREGKAGMVAELAAYDRQDLDTALLAASIYGQAAVIDELTNYGASVYARMDDGRTALMLAAENGRDEAVEMLLEIGANRYSMTDDGKIAADYARDAGHDALAERLMHDEGGDALGFEGEEALGEELASRVGNEGGGSAGTGGGASEEAGEAGATAGGGNGAGGSGVRSGGVRRIPVSLAGATVAVKREESRSELEGGEAGRAEAAPAIRPGSGTSGSAAAPPFALTMRGYQQRELPMRVESVKGQQATIRVVGGKPVTVEPGQAIPGSDLVVLRVERRASAGKDSAGPAEDVSVVEVEDRKSGLKRNLVVGLAATSHDPVALLEDGVSGERYVAKQGQRFRTSDGKEFVVSDVRPNQLVIEDPGTGEVWTLPLRGPRG